MGKKKLVPENGNDPVLNPVPSPKSRVPDFAHYFRDLWDGKRRGVGDRLLLSLLTLLSYPYGLALRLRAAAYATGLFRSHRLPRPVVAVGNLTVGGTGKTPMVAWLANWFMERGKRVAVLSRGYGGSLEGEVRIVADGRSILLSPGEAGDEPCLLAATVPGLMVVIGTDRYRAGCLALERLEPDIFILDDGFQHLRLKRDLNLLLLDCEQPFGSGRTFPAGTLREPQSALRRADLVVYTRCTRLEPKDTTGKPRFTATHRLIGTVPAAGGALRPFAAFGKSRVLAFAGIADPSSFFGSLESEGVNLVATLAFPDHTPYDNEEIAAICRLKDASRADFLITTGKDAVKLAHHLGSLGDIHIATLELQIRERESFAATLEKLL